MIQADDLLPSVRGRLGPDFKLPQVWWKRETTPEAPDTGFEFPVGPHNLAFGLHLALTKQPRKSTETLKVVREEDGDTETMFPSALSSPKSAVQR